LKRAYRLRRDEPLRLARRFALETWDILWHQQTSNTGRALLVAVVFGVPLFIVLLCAGWLFGGTG
jgi:hypothetical protein